MSKLSAQRRGNERVLSPTIGACASVAGSGKGDNFVVVVVVVVDIHKTLAKVD